MIHDLHKLHPISTETNSTSGHLPSLNDCMSVKAFLNGYIWH